MNTLAQNSKQMPAEDIDDLDEKELKRLRDTRSPIWMGFWVLVVGVGLFLAWAAWAPLDEGVPAPASVAVEGRRTTIQHLQGGVVKTVHVKDGAVVKVGDLLIELDDSTTRANHQAVRQTYLSQRALESRLLAEMARAPSITFHPDLLTEKDPMAAQHMAAQQQFFIARRSAHQAEMAAGEQAIAGLEGQINGIAQGIREKRGQLALLSQQAASVRQLADDGFAPRNQALQLEQQKADLNTSINSLETETQRLRSGMAETRLRLAMRRQEFEKETSAQLAEVRREVQARQDQMKAAEIELSRMQIRSPAAGQVIALAIRNPGGVVQHGQPLMDIVPQGSALVLDVKVPPTSISQVSVGNEVEVRFAAFAHKPHLVVLGKLTSLSTDVVSEQIGGMVSSHYVAQVVLTPAGMKALGNEVVQPGMPAEVLIRTGERSMLSYLFGPLVKRVAVALTEQ